MATFPPKFPAWSSNSSMSASSLRHGPATRWLKWIVLAVLAFCGLLMIHRVRSQPSYPKSSLKYQQDYSDDVPEKALVLASYLDQDVSWLTQVSKDWRVYRYIADYYTDPKTNIAGHGLPLAKEQGREANAYLTYIVEHYDRLPHFILFMHGHEQAWHQPEHAYDKMRALNLSSVQREGYVAFKCMEDKLCWPERRIDLSHGPAGIPNHKDLEKLLPAFWLYMFEAEGENRSPLPEILANQGQAQFAVTAEAIRRRPIEFWRRLQRPMLGDLRTFTDFLKDMTFHKWGIPNDDDEVKYWESLKVDSRGVGLLFEKMWHAIFGRDAFDCPNPETCWQTYFGNAIHCEEMDPKPEKKFVVQHVCSVEQGALDRIERENSQLLQRIRDGAG